MGQLIPQPFKIFGLEYSSKIWDNTPDMNKAEEYYDSGIEKANSGDYQGAIKDYDKAIEINPKDAEAYYNRGAAKLGLGQKDSGCLDLYKARELGHSGAYQTIKEHCK